MMRGATRGLASSVWNTKIRRCRGLDEDQTRQSLRARWRPD